MNLFFVYSMLVAANGNAATAPWSTPCDINITGIATSKWPFTLVNALGKYEAEKGTTHHERTVYFKSGTGSEQEMVLAFDEYVKSWRICRGTKASDDDSETANCVMQVEDSAMTPDAMKNGGLGRWKDVQPYPPQPLLLLSVMASCIEKPTPAPTPLYSCNTTLGQCYKDPHGSETAGACIESCKCVPVNNCGQWNATGIISCEKNITTLNVCPTCNLPYLTPGPSEQATCDKCVVTPKPDGCGAPTPAPQLFTCLHDKCIPTTAKGVPLSTCKAACS